MESNIRLQTAFSELTLAASGSSVPVQKKEINLDFVSQRYLRFLLFPVKNECRIIS